MYILKAMYVLTCFNAKSLLFVHNFFKTSSEKGLFALILLGNNTVMSEMGRSKNSGRLRFQEERMSTFKWHIMRTLIFFIHMISEYFSCSTVFQP